MFFEKAIEVTIDGNKYELSMPVYNDTYNCKNVLWEIDSKLEDDQFQMDCSYENYKSWNKELVKKLKEFDKMYTNHVKKTYPYMSDIHQRAMKPLWDLIVSNLNLHYLDKMREKKMDVPDFRIYALEEEFCKFMTGVCQIFKEYGNMVEYFNIKQMMKTLQTPNWKEIVPFEFYLTPLEKQYTKVRTVLLDMHKKGHLLVKYAIEQNTELLNETIEMLKRDKIAQLLLGNPLKQDQFKFLYETTKIIYDSALKNSLINFEQNMAQMDDVISQLVAFKSLLHIRNITIKKAEDAAKELEKKSRPDYVEEEPVEKKDPAHMTQQELLAMKLDAKEGGDDVNEAAA